VGRVIVVGDVHGCIEELEALLVECGATADDKLVFVGDLVGKGPSSRDVVELCRRRDARSARGNHDDRLVRHHEATARGEEGPPISALHEDAARSLSGEDWRYLRALPPLVPIPDHGILVVHGGLRPGVPLHAQAPRDMMTMRSVRPDGSPSRRIEDGVPWGSVWEGPGHVVYGHDAVRGLQLYPHATGLDTGCVYGGRLTALVLPDHELVSVGAKQRYCEPEPWPAGAEP
jgi:hypothetical protein